MIKNKHIDKTRNKTLNKTLRKTLRKTKTNKEKTSIIYKLKGGNPDVNEFLRIANSWNEKGTYILENDNFIVEKYFYTSFNDNYIPNDFMIKFTNYGQFNYGEDHEFYKLFRNKKK